MNLKILVLKTDKLKAFLRPGSNLFHLMIADKSKKIFLKSCGLCQELKCLVHFSFNVHCTLYKVRLTGIKLKRY